MNQLQVLTYNPYYFFGGSQIVKAWLDATATAILCNVRDQHTSQHSKQEVHYRTQRGSSLASVSLRASAQLNESTKYNTLPGAQHETFSSVGDKPEHKTMGKAAAKKTGPLKSSRQIQEHPVRSSKHPEKDLRDKSDKRRLGGRSDALQKDPTDLALAYRMPNTEDHNVSSTVYVSEWTPHHQGTQQELEDTRMQEDAGMQTHTCNHITCYL